MIDTCFICSRSSYDFEHHGRVRLLSSYTLNIITTHAVYFRTLVQQHIRGKVVDCGPFFCSPSQTQKLSSHYNRSTFTKDYVDVFITYGLTVYKSLKSFGLVT